MSISHNLDLGGDGPVRVVINIAGIDTASQHIGEICGALFAYDRQSGVPKFTSSLSIEDLRRLHGHLHRYSVISDPRRSTTGSFVELPVEAEPLRAAMLQVEPSDLVRILKDVLASRLSRTDINIILGRKDALDIFRAHLGNATITEPTWQAFFEKNDWIFGYGLRYCFLKILQREAHVAGTDLAGAGAVISDFLLTDRRFTKLVEIKRPDTPLFKNNRNRSDSWCLSDELTEAVSQILAQQANWELESQRGATYDGKGQRIDETTVDVDCILVIGSLSEVHGSERDRRVKLKTFELFRRNLRNVEILAYDELYRRACFIVLGEDDDATAGQSPTA